MGSAWSRFLIYFVTDAPVLGLEVEQRFAVAHHNVFDFRNKDGVVTGILRGLQAALKIGKRASQNRSAMRGAIEACPGLLFRPRRIAVRLRVVFGNRTLLIGEHVDPEPLAGVQMSMSTRLLVHADQHQQRINGHRTEGVRSHPLDLAFVVHCDDGDTGGEAAHCAPECFLIERHLRIRFVPRSPHFRRSPTSIIIARRTRAAVLSCEWRVEHQMAEQVQSRPLQVPTRGDLHLTTPLSREDAYHWIGASDENLPVLLAAARKARDRFKPGVITYSRKVFIPLTNLCRDYCAYCTFRRDPGQPGAHTMTPEEVLAVARAGQKAGCTEALFSLGDKPELLFPEMRETLRRLGYRSTLHYLEAMCELVLRETSLLPHPNPGLMSAEWISRLSAVSPSMGLMLETTNSSLLAPGAAHDNAPDKLPAKRLRTIEEAGKQGVAFTTGILVGIGESLQDRVDALLAIRDLHRRYGHIQEIIIQNFRAKPEIPMHEWPEPSRGEMLRTIAVTRLLMPNVNIQAPPNLSDPDYEELLDAGINDWGGISPLTPDFINPERPWPHLLELEKRTKAKGFKLRQRLPVYPEFLPLTRGHGEMGVSPVLRVGTPGTPRSLLTSRVETVADAAGYARSAA